MRERGAEGRGKLTAALATVLIGACGAGERTGPEDSGTAIEVPTCSEGDTEGAAAFIEAYAAAICEGYQTCSHGFTWWSVEDCAAFNPTVSRDSYLTMVPTEAVDAVAAGEASYDDGTAAECLDFLRGYCSYDDPDGLELRGSACSRVFTPTECAAVTATPCTGADCTVGTYCPLGEATCDFRRCQEEKAVGEQCLYDVECGSDLFCLPYSFHCGRITMLEPAGEGETCRFLSTDNPIATDYRLCRAGLACLPDETGSLTWRCALPRASGEECNPEQYNCTANYLCAMDTDGVTRCLPSVFAPEGEPCGDRAGCDPREGLVCDYETRVCMAYGDGRDDAVCDVFRRSCQPGYYCHVIRNRCEPTQPVGDLCTEHAMCDSFCCSDGVCGEAP